MQETPAPKKPKPQEKRTAQTSQGYADKLYPQVTAEWREVEWSKEKRLRFAQLILRLITTDDDDSSH
ncbi:hypothetical protein ACFYQ5_07840 [Streptomyces sp. NPDC005794]|uniref:hypothetical protein n=1 Tax=Streptomyces sp. NPDC005794 TaxID=3364733 RepID=UPI0036B94CC2